MRQDGTDSSSRRDSADGERAAREWHLDELEWSRLLDGETLSAARLAHRTSCAPCAAEWRLRVRLSETLRHAAPAELPPGLATRITARLARKTPRFGGADDLPGWLTWWGRPAGILAAAALLVLSVLFAPRLAARAVALPNEWAWAAGLNTAQDPLASEWEEDSLVLDASRSRSADAGGSLRSVTPVERRHPPAERSS